MCPRAPAGSTGFRAVFAGFCGSAGSTGFRAGFCGFCVGFCGFLRVCTVLSAFFYVFLRVFVWVFEGFCGLLRVSAGFCGFLRVPAGFCGFLRVSVGSCGFSLISDWVSVIFSSLWPMFDQVVVDFPRFELVCEVCC